MNRKPSDLLGVLSRMGGAARAAAARKPEDRASRREPARPAPAPQGPRPAAKPAGPARPAGAGPRGVQGPGLGHRLAQRLQGHVVVPVGGIVAAGIVLVGVLFCTWQFAHRMGSLAVPGQGATGRVDGPGIAGPLQVKRPQTMQDQDQRREPADRDQQAEQPGPVAAERPDERAKRAGGESAAAGIGALPGAQPAATAEPRVVRGLRVISYRDTPGNQTAAGRLKDHLNQHGIADVELVRDKSTLCVFVPAAGDSKADLEALRKKLQRVPPPPIDPNFKFDDLMPATLTRK